MSATPLPSSEFQAAVRDVLAGMLDELAAGVAERLGKSVQPDTSPEVPGPSEPPEAVAPSKDGNAEKPLPPAPTAEAHETVDRIVPASAEKAGGEEGKTPGAAMAASGRDDENARLILTRIWPRWVRDDNLDGWKTRLETQLFAPELSPAVGLLFAALHGYSAALPDTDAKTLLDALRDLGRRLYGYLRENEEGLSEGESARVAELWAQAINQECEGRCEVEVPVPGHAANSQWMIFQPRGGSSPDIVAVRSWCVRDAQKRPVHRAEVNV